jgi:hypothetical protein
MRRIILLGCAIAFALAMVFGCSGDDGSQGPMGTSGQNGVPQPIKVLMAAADGEGVLEDLAISFFALGAFPIGSEIEFFDSRDSIPPLSVLQQYDAVLVYLGSTGQNFVDSLGNVLADYVDAGGGVVLGAYYLSDTWKMTGRIMTAGYSPLASAAEAGRGDRQLDETTISFPLHPVFNGTDVSSLTLWGNNNISDPVLASGATALAMDVFGAPAVAVNANGRIMAVNTDFGNAAELGYDDAIQLVANCLLFVADAF